MVSLYSIESSGIDLLLFNFYICSIQFEVPHLHISETNVFYGSPGLSSESYVLSGYKGLPFVLSNFRLRFSIVIRKIMMLGQLPETGKGTIFDYFLILTYFIRRQTIFEPDLR